MKITAIALITTLAAAPAMACADWKAVAAFDAIISANDKAAVKDEVAAQDNSSGIPGFPSCAVFEANLAKGIAAKNDHGEDISVGRYKLCHAAEMAAQDHQTDVLLDRKAAIADKSGERRMKTLIFGIVIGGVVGFVYGVHEDHGAGQRMWSAGALWEIDDAYEVTCKSTGPEYWGKISNDYIDRASQVVETYVDRDRDIPPGEWDKTIEFKAMQAYNACSYLRDESLKPAKRSYEEAWGKPAVTWGNN